MSINQSLIYKRNVQTDKGANDRNTHNKCARNVIIVITRRKEVDNRLEPNYSALSSSLLRKSPHIFFSPDLFMVGAFCNWRNPHKSARIRKLHNNYLLNEAGLELKFGEKTRSYCPIRVATQNTT